MDIVLDASAAVHALVPSHSGSAPLLARLRSITCHAPHLVDAEVGSVLSRAVRQGRTGAPLAEGALRALDSLVSSRYPHGVIAGRAWTLRRNLSYYDALYVALAARLANAAGLPCEVHLVD